MKTVEKSNNWIKGAAFCIGGFLAAFVLSGAVTIPLCKGRDLQLWAFLGAPVSLFAIGALLAALRLCALRHIVLTLTVLQIVLVAAVKWYGGPSGIIWSANLLLAVPWCVGIFTGNQIRKWIRI